MKTSKNILVYAYALSPYRGSEYSVAWNYLKEMAKEHNLTVLYGTNGDHLGDFLPVQALQQYFPNKKVRFIPVQPSKSANFLNILNRRGICGYSFYLAYYLWQNSVFQAAQKLITENDFDLIHYLCPIGYREPGYLWQLPLPYIWGPIGGLRNVPPVLLKTLPAPGRFKLAIRSCINSYQQQFSLRIRQAFTRADVVLASTEETCDIIWKRFHIKAEYLPENGIVEETRPNFINEKFNFQKLKLIWVGRIDARKSLRTLLETLKRIKEKGDFHLDIVGDGPLKKSLVKLAEFNKINDNITWHGHVTRKYIPELFNAAHVHIITSCNEANTTVLFEAMAAGIPTISLDHCGMHDTICEQCGIRIPIYNYEQIITDLGNAIVRLCHHPEEVKRLSEGALQCAAKYSWGKRHEFFNRQYEKAIAHYKTACFSAEYK